MPVKFTHRRERCSFCVKQVTESQDSDFDEVIGSTRPPELEPIRQYVPVCNAFAQEMPTRNCVLGAAEVIFLIKAFILMHHAHIAMWQEKRFTADEYPFLTPHIIVTGAGKEFVAQSISRAAKVGCYKRYAGRRSGFDKLLR